ncbi:lipoprotein [Catenovulum agarivorans DS-2]|uniref:Lipoprotein n=1 Tax=Catenovulum agarivorans DS-2 TaxID=1328313 RepID=W7Q8R0_9ALTE|nr:hypothetical protein [Catenovulum agarivorans]EWH08396.1 lipoprotein [Catenovulum agarivorans DS-2]
MKLTKHWKNLLVACAPLVLAACVVVPEKIEYYDKDCQVVSRTYTLTTQEVKVYGPISNCSNNECVNQVTGMVFAAVIAVPISAVVSGSIVIVGNTFYWLEKQGKCVAKFYPSIG